MLDTAAKSALRRRLAGFLGALLMLLGTASAHAQARRRCNTAPAEATSTYSNTGLTSLARREPRTIEPLAAPRIGLSPGFTLLRAPQQWASVALHATILPAPFLWLEGGGAFGLPTQSDMGARQATWADGRLGVRVWKWHGELAWRFVLAACRESNYMPNRWEEPGLGGAPGSMVSEPTRLDYVKVEVPVEHALWMDGAVRWGWLAYRPCPDGRCGRVDPETPAQAAAIATWAAGLRYARFTVVSLDDKPLRAGLEVWGYMLFKPMGLPPGPVITDGPILPDHDPEARKQLGAEVGVRYTPWAFEWAQVEVAAGYTPAAADLILQIGINFPLWLE